MRPIQLFVDCLLISPNAAVRSAARGGGEEFLLNGAAMCMTTTKTDQESIEIIY